MIPELEFSRPESIKETLHLLAQTDRNSRLLAGGTDIITGIQMNSKRFRNIDLLIDINQIPELKGVKETDDYILIGGNVTFTELMESQIAQKALPLLTKASSMVGNVQIRNRATITGNVINNAPCADAIPALLVYDAIIKIESISKRRKLPLQQFLTGTYKTLIQPDELVTQILIPKEATKLKGAFYKLGRRKSVAISRIALAVLLDVENNRIKEIKIANGAVSNIGERLPELEKWANGKELSDDLFKSLATKMAQKLIDENGLRWSSAYKITVLQQAFFQLFKNLT